MSRMRWSINVGLLLASVAITLGLLEASVRISGVVSLTPRPPKIFQKSEDPALSYELRPSVKEVAYRATVTTNALGLRGPEPDLAKPVIAVLGDSITFGYGVEDEETLPARLQERLPTHAVLNGAAPGYTLGQEATLYRTKLAALNPSALVLVFYWNDLTDNRPAILDDRGIIRAPDWTPDQEPPCRPIETGILALVPGKCWLDRNSALYVLVKKIAVARQEQRNLAEQREEYAQNPTRNEAPKELVDAYAATLKTFAATLPSGMPKLFAIWPDKVMHVETRPQLKAIAEREGFRVIDLYETFGNTAETLSWDTVHPSAATLRQAADVIAPVIDDMLP